MMLIKLSLTSLHALFTAPDPVKHNICLLLIFLYFSQANRLIERTYFKNEISLSRLKQAYFDT
jgi:hypothetical protein